jgi:hypothetical protein
MGREIKREKEKERDREREERKYRKKPVRKIDFLFAISLSVKSMCC